MQKEIADRRIAFGTALRRVPRTIRDVLRDDPTIVDLDSAGAKSTMTRATDIERQASEWLIRSEAGEFTDETRAALEHWLEDPLNRVTFLRIKEAWRRANRMRGTRPLDGNVDPDLLKDPDLTCGPTDKGGSGWSFRIAAAAAAALIIYLAGLVAWAMLSPGGWISYTTSIGGYEQITLPDGSGIQLNTDTEIRARITHDRRELNLIRGEAQITVTQDTRRPFMVSTDGVTLRAQPSGGSRVAFSMRRRAAQSVDVAVTDGSLILGPSERIIDVALGRDPAFQSTLAAGYAASIRPAGVHLVRVGLEELNRRLSWTAGLLSFQGETLSEVTDEFNRYNRKHLVVTDPLIANRRIGGAFQATDPESFVSALQKWFGVRADEQIPPGSGAAVIRLSRSGRSAAD